MQGIALHAAFALDHRNAVLVEGDAADRELGGLGHAGGLRGERVTGTSQCCRVGAHGVSLRGLRRDVLGARDLVRNAYGKAAEIPLTQAQRHELDRRLDDLEGEGPVGIPWEDVLRAIKKRNTP